MDALKFFGSITVAIPFLYLCTGHTVLLLQRIQCAAGAARHAPPATQKAPPAPAAPFAPPFSAALETLLALAVAAAAAAAYGLPGQATHVLFSLATLHAYVFAARLPRLLPPAAARLAHPLLVSSLATSALLAAFAAATGRGFFPVLRDYLVPGGAPLRARPGPTSSCRRSDSGTRLRFHGFATTNNCKLQAIL